MPFAALVAMALLAIAAPAMAQTPGHTPPEIPGSPLAFDVEEITGAPAAADPRRPQRIPQHPFMAPNPESNLQNDAYQSDVCNRAGPLGDGISSHSVGALGGLVRFADGP